MDSAYFLVVVEAKKIVFRNFFLNLDPLCGPVAAKPLVVELLCLELGGHFCGVCPNC